MSGPPARAASMLNVSPPIGEDEAARVAERFYGVRGVAERLDCEKDETFRVTGPGEPVVLRIAHLSESASSMDLGTQVLLHLARRAPELPVERVVKTIGGEAELRFTSAAGDRRRARMTTLLGGRMLRSIGSTAELRPQLGATLARLTLALADFTHPALDRYVMWDIRQAALTRELVALAADDPVDMALGDFEAAVLPALETLERVAVHSDFTDGNILVDGSARSITGIVDFGDMTATPRICDLAVAMSTELAPGDDPLGPAVDLVRAYHEVTPLTELELSLLSGLVRTRVALRIAISEHRAARFPENQEYILRRTAEARSLLARLPTDRAGVTADRFTRACGI